jgi:hypothetical protein
MQVIKLQYHEMCGANANSSKYSKKKILEIFGSFIMIV